MNYFAESSSGGSFHLFRVFAVPRRPVAFGTVVKSALRRGYIFGVSLPRLEDRVLERAPV
jgi:hypothetical protein